MKCYIVRDLLPGYIEEITGEEANAKIKEHLETCEACRIIYEQMSAEILEDSVEKGRNIDFFKKLKAKLRKQNAIAALSACLIIALAIAFLRNYGVSIPYDPIHMSVEVEHAVAIPDPPYTTVWRDQDLLDFETTKAVLAGEYDDCNWRDFVHLRYKGFNCPESHKYGRIIQRDGEAVEVVYYCLTRTLWDCLVYGNGPEVSWQGGLDFVGNLDDNSVYHSYVPRKTEIYYLPVRELNRLKRLSDEAFYEEREKAVLVWSGVI